MSTPTVGGRLALDGEKEYKKAVTEINRDVRLLAAEMKKVTAEFARNADSEAALIEKSGVLSKQISTQTGKIELMKSALENARKEFGEDSRQAKEWEISIANAETQLAKTKNELADTSDKLDGMNDELAENDQLLEKSEKSSKRLSDGFTVMKGVIANLVTDGIRKMASTLKDFIADGLELASDLEEVSNVTGTTFGRATDDIKAFARDAPRAFGLATLEAERYAGRYGAALKSIGGLSETDLYNMSTQLTGLTGDLASFYNLTAEETNKKLFGGVISGETEGLKSLGIVMSATNLEAYRLSEGLEKPYNKMSEAEKIQLRYNYLLKSTADAQGDFARTSDSWANQIKTLKMGVQTLAGQIGEKLLPILKPALQLANDVITRLSDAFEKDGFSGFLDEAGEIFSELKEKFLEGIPGAVTDALELLTENFPQIAATGTEILMALIRGIIMAIPEIVKSIPDIIWAITDSLYQMAEEIEMAGNEMGAELWEGFTSWWSGTRIGQWVNGIVDNIKSAFGGQPISAGGSASTGSGAGRASAQASYAPAASAGRSATTIINVKQLSKSDVDYIVNQTNKALGR